MLRRILIALHLAGAALSIALLVSTFVAKGIIASKAKSIAVEKSRRFSDPLVADLGDTLEHPVYGKAIPGKVREKLEGEIADYRASPDAWLLRLAVGGAERGKDFEFPEIKNPLARAAVDLISKGVSGLKGHIEESYRDLISDVRLFAGTNLLAFGIAAWLCRVARTPRSRHWLLAFSGLMLVVLLMSISSYLDQNWTWSIVTGRYMGWAYPFTVGLLTYFGIRRISPDLARTQPADSDDSPRP